MSKQDRPPATQPATTHERRRYITLVQILAIEDHAKRRDGIQALCSAWGVDSNGMKYDEIIQALATHAVEYHKEQP